MRLNFNHPNIKKAKLQDLRKLNDKCRQARNMQKLLGTKSCKDLFNKNRAKPGSFEDLDIRRLEE